MAPNTCVVTSDITDDVLMIHLAGSVTANNAPDVEETITGIRAQWPGLPITLDAEELEYLASAGLRVVMRLIKAVGELTLINANPEVYDVFEMTGFTELMSVRRALRSVSVEGCPVVGSGATATVYRLDSETVVKVYNENVFMTMRPVAESRLPVGSSAKMTAGSFTKARAMATRCICPPESSLDLCLKNAAGNPTAANAASARSRRSFRGTSV